METLSEIKWAFGPAKNCSSLQISVFLGKELYEMQVTQRKLKKKTPETGKALIWGLGFRVNILPWPVLRRVRSSVRGHSSLFQVERGSLHFGEHEKEKH